MSAEVRRTIAALLLALLTLGAAGCGMKGDLYTPEAAPAAELDEDDARPARR